MNSNIVINNFKVLALKQNDRKSKVFYLFNSKGFQTLRLNIKNWALSLM
jgi:hypothetical protein